VEESLNQKQVFVKQVQMQKKVRENGVETMEVDLEVRRMVRTVVDLKVRMVVDLKVRMVVDLEARMVVDLKVRMMVET
jgi:hypothetical protein